MTYPFRDQYHRARKAVLRAGDALRPSEDLNSVVEPLFERHDTYNAPDAATPMSAQALQWIDEHKGKPEIEGLYQTRFPCTIEPKLGMLFKNGRIIWGSSDFPVRERSPGLRPHFVKPAKRLPKAILLHHLYGDNYFHFFLFIMSKVWQVEEFGLPETIPFLINERTAQKPYFKDALEMGAFKGREVIVQAKRECVRVDEAYLPRPLFLRANSLSWMADRMRQGQPVKNGQPVFALRARNAANGRTFRNQTEVTALMERLGFKVIDPATLSLRQQVEVFSQAPIIAGAHGAALTNILFRAGADTGVIELFSPGMGSPHYYMIAKELGFIYDSMMTNNPIGRDFTASTEVDLHILESKVRNALGKIS